MRSEIVEIIDQEKRHGSEGHLHHVNCAECMLMAGNQHYQLGLDDQAMKIMAGMGGGLNTENNCGAIIGGVGVLGVMFKEDPPSENTQLKEIVKDFVARCIEKLSDVNCDQIKRVHRDEQEGCNPVKIIVGDVLSETITRFQAREPEPDLR